jgi:hypothetical protein
VLSVAFLITKVQYPAKEKATDIFAGASVSVAV